MNSVMRFTDACTVAEGVSTTPASKRWPTFG